MHLGPPLCRLRRSVRGELMADIFVSHAANGREHVGTTYHREIETVIRTSECVVVPWSTCSMPFGLLVCCRVKEKMHEYDRISCHGASLAYA